MVRLYRNLQTWKLYVFILTVLNTHFHRDVFNTVLLLFLDNLLCIFFQTIVLFSNKWCSLYLLFPSQNVRYLFYFHFFANCAGPVGEISIHYVRAKFVYEFRKSFNKRLPTNVAHKRIKFVFVIGAGTLNEYAHIRR